MTGNTTRAPLLAAILAALVLVPSLAVPSTAAAYPTIKGTSVTDVTQHNAVLNAVINPNGLETTYQFRLQSEPCGGGGGACQFIVVYDLPSSTLPASSEDQNVSLDLNAAGVTLPAGSKFRYWVEANNGSGPTVKGFEQTFTTEAKPPPPVKPPSIVGQSVTGITKHDAVLNAVINPNGLETTYKFRLQSEPCGGGGGACLFIVAYDLPSSTLPAYISAQEVSLDLNAVGKTLPAGSKFRYWVEATNAAGPTVKGPEQTFTTEAEPPPPVEPEPPVPERPTPLQPAPLGNGITGSVDSPALASPPALVSQQHRPKRHRHKHKRLHRRHRVVH